MSPSELVVREEYFKKFKELTRKKLGEEQYNKMTEQELFASATALITLMGAVERHINSPTYQNKDSREPIS